MADKKAELNKLAFFRITLVGASNSGKTSLITTFVNGICPVRYTKTDKAVVFHKKVEVIDDGEWEDVRKPILVEIEDTPGSERGYDDGDGGPSEKVEDRGPPTVKRGSRVTLLPPADKNQVVQMFNNAKYNGRLRYKSAMDGMLGREYPVKEVGKDGSVGLPSPDGSEGGVWNFPMEAVKLKVSMELPIDNFLQLGEHVKKNFNQLAERKKYLKALQIPLSAYERPIGNADLDKTLTKNRMGYFLCFDMSDSTGESLREVMSIHQMLKDSLAKRVTNKLRPIVWVIGCKSDRNSDISAWRKNKESAEAWSAQEEIPFKETSARQHKDVTAVFHGMIQAIQAVESLWSLDAADDDVQEDEGGTCMTS